MPIVKVSLCLKGYPKPQNISVSFLGNIQVELVEQRDFHVLKHLLILRCRGCLQTSDLPYSVKIQCCYHKVTSYFTTIVMQNAHL